MGFHTIERSSNIRGVEVTHAAGYDLLVNTKIDGDSERVKRLLQQVKDGIPTTWQDAFPSANSLYLVDQKPPNFFAKVRLQRGVRNSEEPPKTPEDKLRQMIGNAYDSLLSELYLAPKIKAILASSEVTRVAEEYGFTGVKYAEPLIGLIHRQRRKIMIYDYIDGVEFRQVIYERAKNNSRGKTGDSQGAYVQEFQRHLRFATQIGKVFERNNIVAEDLTLRQFMVPNDGTIYLIDTEGYVDRSRG